MGGPVVYGRTSGVWEDQGIPQGVLPGYTTGCTTRVYTTSLGTPPPYHACDVHIPVLSRVAVKSAWAQEWRKAWVRALLSAKSVKSVNSC